MLFRHLNTHGFKLYMSGRIPRDMQKVACFQRLRSRFGKAIHDFKQVSFCMTNSYF